MVGMLARRGSSRAARVVAASVAAACLVLSVSAFGDGRYPVGTGAGHIPGGTYTTAGGANCYWERDDLSGGIIANDFIANPQRTIVTVDGTDGAFDTRRCGDWQPLGAAPLTAGPNAPVPDGTWRVGTDVAGNNRWISSASTGDCYWERLSSFHGGLAPVIDNFFGSGPTTVVLSASDVGFHSNRCGTWIRDTQLDPFGSLDTAASDNGGIRVVGWAQDRETGSPIDVHVYVDGTPRAVLHANVGRPDVGAHGYAAVVAVGAGTHLVCTYGINVGLGENAALGCRSVTVIGNPVGNLERITYSPAGLRVSGWAFDPNSVAPIKVPIYIDGRGRAVPTASQPRPDIGRAFPGYGDDHGFAVTVPIGGGAHSVCAYGINVGIGANATIGCRTFVTPTAPTGSIDAITARYDTVRVRGWAIDPNTADPVGVRVYVDGVGRAALTASSSRPDIGKALPAYGPNHGFDLTGLQLGNGAHQVCVYAINLGIGAANSTLGCRTVRTSGNPVGGVDAFVEAVGGVKVRGWAFDPDVATPITVRVYVDGAFRQSLPAGSPRPDVASSVPGAGPDTGFTGDKIMTPPGSHQVCVYGINAGIGTSSTLGCATVTVHTG
jgi:hypothetical protein